MATSIVPSYRTPVKMGIEMAREKYDVIELWHSHTADDCKQYGLGSIVGLRAPPHDHTNEKWNTYWNRFHENDVPEVIKECKFFNCFSTLNHYCLAEMPDDETANTAYYDLGLDFDSKDDPERAFADLLRVGAFLTEVGLEVGAHYIPEFSGSKGAAIRLPYELFGQKPLPVLTGSGNHIIAKVVAEKIVKETGIKTLDMRVYSKRRQWRLPGTIHPSTGLWRTQFDLDDFRKGLTYIKKHARNRRGIVTLDRVDPHSTLCMWWAEATKKLEQRMDDKIERRNKTRSKGIIARQTGVLTAPRLSTDAPPPCVVEALEVGITERGAERGTNRNDITLQLAIFFKEVGVDERDAVDTLIRHAKGVLALFSSSSNDEIEASTRSCVRSVYAGDYSFSCGAMRACGFECDAACGIQGLDLGGLRAPPGYFISERGVYAIVRGGEDGARLMRITSEPIWIDNRFVSDMHEVKLSLSCGNRTIVVERDAAVIPRRMADRLAGLDLPVEGGNLTLLSTFLARFEEVNRDAFPAKRLATRLGWHGDSFVFPGIRADERVEAPGPGELRFLRALRAEGSLTEYTAAVARLRPSPKAMAVIWACFAPPLLKLMRCPNFAVHAFYESSAGKTIVQEAGASIWGDPSPDSGLIQPWNATIVGLEQRAAFCSDLPLLLSEVGTAKKDRIEQAIYMLIEGQGRTRGDRRGGTRSAQSWRTVVVSTGETSLTAASNYTGPAVRVLEVYGNLLAHLDGDGAVEVEHAVRDNYGVAGINLVETLLTKSFFRGEVASEYRRWHQILSAQFDTPFGHRMAAYGAALAVAADILHNVILCDGIMNDEISAVVGTLLREETSEKAEPYAERALAALDSWVSENESHFQSSAREQYGRFLATGVAIFPTVLERACEELGLDFIRVKRDFTERNWLHAEMGRYTKTVRIDGVSKKLIVMKRIERPTDGGEVRSLLPPGLFRNVSD